MLGRGDIKGYQPTPYAFGITVCGHINSVLALRVGWPKYDSAGLLVDQVDQSFIVSFWLGCGRMVSREQNLGVYAGSCVREVPELLL